MACLKGMLGWRSLFPVRDAQGAGLPQPFCRDGEGHHCDYVWQNRQEGEEWRAQCGVYHDVGANAHPKDQADRQGVEGIPRPGYHRREGDDNYGGYDY